MNRAVRWGNGRISSFGLLASLLLLFPWEGTVSAQGSRTRPVTPPDQVYQLTGGTVTLPGLVFEEDETPDWKLDPSLPVPPIPVSTTGGAMGSAAAGFPTFRSSSLWSNYQDVVTFEVGGNTYAVAALAAGLKFFDLSTGTPVYYWRWHTETGTWRMAVEGTRLYVVDYFETRVHIFDVSNPLRPLPVRTDHQHRCR